MQSNDKNRNQPADEHKTPYTQAHQDVAAHHVEDEAYKSPYVTTEPGATQEEEKSPYTHEKPAPDKAGMPFKSPYTTPEAG